MHYDIFFLLGNIVLFSHRTSIMCLNQDQVTREFSQIGDFHSYTWYTDKTFPQQLNATQFNDFPWVTNSIMLQSKNYNFSYYPFIPCRFMLPFFIEEGKYISVINSTLCNLLLVDCLLIETQFFLTNLMLRLIDEN